MSKTRFAELGYTNNGSGWRFVTTEDGAHVGPHYASKVELLADLERYAASYGCEGATKQAVADWSKIRLAHDELHARLLGNTAASIERARDMLAAVLHECGEFGEPPAQCMARCMACRGSGFMEATCGVCGGTGYVD